jgi:Xaa-Pro aminopeptidase
VVTVEPGIYMPGLGGVRIEDMVVVTQTARAPCRAPPRSSRSSEPLHERPEEGNNLKLSVEL